MAEEIIFKVGVNTGSTVNDLNKIDKELQEVDKSAKSIGTDAASKFEALNKAVESGTLSMRESTKAIKEYQTIALQSGAESPIGQEAIARAAALTDELGDLRTQIQNASHDGASMQAALQLGSGLTAGYGALEGAMALVGGESEDLQKTMVKLQAVQSVLAGIEQVRATLEAESFLMMKAKTVSTKILTVVEGVYATAVGTTTGAMKALRIAMLALPIVAIIAGIVALVAVISSLTAEEEKAEDVNNKLTDSYERQQQMFERAMASRKRETQNQIDLAKARGASEEEVFQMERDQILQNEAIRRRSLKTEGGMIIERKKAYTMAFLEGNKELQESIKKEIEQHRNKYKDLKALDNQFKVDLELKKLEFDKQQQEKQDEADKQAADKAKANAESARRRREEEAKKRIELERTMEDLVAANIEDANQRAVTQLAIKHQRERDELISKYGKNSALIKELEKKQQDETLALLNEQDKAYNDQIAENEKVAAEEAAKVREAQARSDKAELEAKLLRIEDDFNAEQELKKELAALEMEQAKADKTLTTGELLKIDEEYNAKIRDIDKETAEHNKQLKQEEIDRAVEWTEKSINALQNLGDAYFTNRLAKVEKGSKAEEDLARKQFKFNKALQLGGAIMDAGKAITASLASSPIAIGPVPNPAGIASLAFVAAQGAASITKILATKFEGGGSSSAPSVSPPSISSNTVSAPIPNNDGTSTLTAGLQGAQPATKVIVVESDITMKQEQVKKVDTLTSFGG